LLIKLKESAVLAKPFLSKIQLNLTNKILTQANFLFFKRH